MAHDQWEGQNRPRPLEVSYERWIWGVEIPWLPDLLSDGVDATVTGRPLVEAFGRQVGFLRAVAATRAGQAFQVRFVAEANLDLPVRVYLLGRAASAGVSSDSAALALGALPSEYPTKTLGPDELVAVLA